MPDPTDKAPESADSVSVMHVKDLKDAGEWLINEGDGYLMNGWTPAVLERKKALLDRHLGWCEQTLGRLTNLEATMRALQAEVENPKR